MPGTLNKAFNGKENSSRMNTQFESKGIVRKP